MNGLIVLQRVVGLCAFSAARIVPNSTARRMTA